MSSETDCEVALEQYEQVLCRLKNVVGLGIAGKARHATPGHDAPPMVTVYVSRKVPESQLAPEDLVPPLLEIQRGGERIKVPTQVVEQGDVELESLGLERLE